MGNASLNTPCTHYTSLLLKLSMSFQIKSSGLYSGSIAAICYKKSSIMLKFCSYVIAEYSSQAHHAIHVSTAYGHSRVETELLSLASATFPIASWIMENKAHAGPNPGVCSSVNFAD